MRLSWESPSRPVRRPVCPELSGTVARSDCRGELGGRVAAAVPAVRRPALPARVRLFVAATVALALLLLPLAWRSPGTLDGPAAVVATALLLALVVGAHAYSVRLAERHRVAVGTAAEVAAVLLLPG